MISGRRDLWHRRWVSNQSVGDNPINAVPGAVPQAKDSCWGRAPWIIPNGRARIRRRWGVNLGSLAALLGLIGVGALRSVQAEPLASSSQVAGSESTDPALIVQELSRLEAQIDAQARPVSLQEAISHGIRANPQLLEAFSTIQQYEWQLIAAQRQWYPTLQLTNGTPFAGIQWRSFSETYATASSVRTSSSSTSRLTTLQPGVTISWNAIDPTRQPNINAASESLKQQKLLFDVSARNLVLAIEQAYYSTQSTRELIKNFRKIYAINEEQLAMLEGQRTIGMTTVLDVEATRAQLFDQLNQLVGYTRSYIDQTANLAAVLALPQGTLAIPSEPAALRGRWPLTLEQTISRALKQREEIKASLAAAEAARWTAVASLRSYLPVIQLVGSGSMMINDGTQAYSSGNVRANETISLLNNSSYIGLGFSWSFFDGGIQAANAQAARAQARQQSAQAASLELETIQQVRSSYGQLMTARLAYNSAQQSYRSADLAQRASRARFAVGVGDITSLVQTIQQLSQSAEQISEATLTYNTALAQLHRYSATWPSETEAAVQQRLQGLRTDSVPASLSTTP